jgi:hypothetical protein
VFDWDDDRKGFGGIMRKGGFDCVIGNPPYVLLQDQLRDNVQTEYFRKVFKSASYKIDLYHLFIEKAIRLANNEGYISMITPANFMTNIYLVNLREIILSKTTIHSINTIRGEVFSGVGVDNSIFVFCKEKAKHKHEAELIFSQPNFSNIKPQKSYNVLQALFMKDKQHLFVPKSSEESWDKIWNRSISLGKLCDVNFGMQLRNRKKYLKDVIQLRNEDELPTGYARCYTGRDINRYSVKWSGLACLENRKAQRGGCWDLEKHHQSGKLLTKQIGKWPSFGLDSRGYNCLNTIFMVTNKSKQYSTAYLLGILNSTLMRAFWLSNYYDQRITFPKIKGTYLEQLPIRTIDFSNPVEKAQHDKLVALVGNMLELQKKHHEAKMERDKELFERQIKIVDEQIDRLVYDLYGLSEEEVKVVEGSE